jgi:glycosyltransferase involved in cell wall biosynthesis
LNVALPAKCVIIGPAFPLRGGIAQLNESLAQQLTALGVETSIYSFSLQYPEFLFPGKSQKEIGNKTFENFQIHSTINSIAPWTWISTAKMIAAERPEIMIVRFWIPFMAPCLAYISRYVRKKLNIPIVGLLDNVIPHEHRLGDRTLTKMFLNSCNCFAVMSSSVMSDLGSFDRVKTRKLLYHPVYDHFGEKIEMQKAREHLGLSYHDKVILFFGLVRNYKGLDILLEAVAKMPQREHIKVLVAGEFYEDKALCLSIIRMHGLEHNVIIRDEFIPEDEVKYYFCASNIVAQPYRTATQSGVTQIAYHFETPMLVTNVGGLAEIVPNRVVGYVCRPEPQVISEQLSLFFTGNDEEEFRLQLPKEKMRFEWKNFAKEMVIWDSK